MNMVNLKISLQTTWVDLETTILTEVSQTEVEKYHIDIAYMQNLKKKKNLIQMNLFANQKQAHRLREQTYGYQ